MRNRREIWRDFMGRFEPSGDPRDAVQRGFYVPRPGRSMAEQLAARFELKPSAAHLLVGGVGSGKTTQLLIAQQKLQDAGDVCTIYIDLSMHSDIERINSAGVLAAIGLELGPLLETEADHGEDFSAFVDYLRRPTARAWRENILDLFAAKLKEFTGELPQGFRDVVVLVDSLDRLSDLDRFSNIVDGAVVELRGLGIGVVLVGPLASIYGIERVTIDRFDRVWHLPTVDVESDMAGQEFLLQVLKARDVNGLLTEEAAQRVVVSSGGVLRDLMALTQTAGEEAYVHGAEQVCLEHVDVAADLFGRKLMVGLDSQQLAVLQRVRTQGTFVQTSEKDLALLATRRVLEYSNGKPRFAVHPTIEPLLAQIPEVP